MATNPTPTDAQRQAFVAKLNAFRGGLGPTERQMLDALVAAAREAHEQHDVEVYWLTAPGTALGGALGQYGAYSGTATYSGMTEGTV